VLGIGELANPMKAHNGYQTDERVIGLIWQRALDKERMILSNENNVPGLKWLTNKNRRVFRDRPRDLTKTMPPIRRLVAADIPAALKLALKYNLYAYDADFL
jgi:hypothetical protein